MAKKDTQSSSKKRTSKKASSSKKDTSAKKDSGQEDSANKKDTSTKKDSGKKDSTNEDNQERKPAKSGTSELIRTSKEIFAELTGQAPESVSGMQRNDDGWRITIETVELRRIPNSTDVLASYELDLTEDGDVLGYRRARRYLRNQAEES